MHVDVGIPELLESLPAAARGLVEHVAQCETCRLRVLMAIEESENLGLEPPEPEEGELPTPMMGELLKRALERASRQETVAERRGRDLVVLPGGEALAAILEGREPCSPALALRLLPDALATEGEPDLREERANLVLALGGALGCEGEGRGVAECNGRAWSTLGEVARLRGDRGRAEMAFGFAAEALELTELDLSERGLYARLCARLRAEQGRLDEALGLLERAVQVYSANGAYSQAGEALAERGLLLLEEQEIDSAALALRAAINLLNPKEALWLTLRARQGLALCEAERGKAPAAEAAWWRGEGWPPLDEHEWSDVERLRLTAMYAEITERSGMRERAARLLQVAAEGLAERGELHLAASVTADLLRVLAGLGEGKKAAGLRGQLAGLGKESPAWAVIGFLFDLAGSHDEVPTGADGYEVFRAAAEYLRRARHNHALTYHPRWRPRAVLSWQRLGEARREACRLALVPDEVASCPEKALDLETQQRLAWVYEAYTEIRILFLRHDEGEETC
jgi:tetratricopeptide (TPR) repeat protein